MKQKETAGGVIVRKGRVAVVAHPNGVWTLPKGKRKKGETLLETAYREIEEETGLTELRLVKNLGTYRRHRIGLEEMDDPSEMKKMTFYLFTTDQKKLEPQDPKHPEAKWVKVARVAKMLTHPKDRKFFRKHESTVAATDS